MTRAISSRRRSGRARPDHGARPRPDRALPGLPLCRLAGAQGVAGIIARRARASSTPRRCRSTRSSRNASAPTADGHDVARLHSGDLSVWSAMGEQLRRLREAGIAYTVTPGVPSLRRGCRRARPGADPARSRPVGGADAYLGPRFGRCRRPRTLETFAATGATLAIHLSIHTIDKVVAALLPHYGADCPAAVVYRASWPEERVIRATCSTLRGRGRQNAHRAHGADPGRQGAAGARLPRQRALRRLLSTTLPGPRPVTLRCPKEFPGAARLPGRRGLAGGRGPRRSAPAHRAGAAAPSAGPTTSSTTRWSIAACSIFAATAPS